MTNQRTRTYTRVVLLSAQIFLAAMGWAQAISLPEPFTQETAIQKVRMAEDGWNSRDPEKVALAYTRWSSAGETARSL